MNIWDKFSNLDYKSPKKIATVNALDTGIVVVQFLNGGTEIIETETSYTVGQEVYVQDGEIIGLSPALTYFTADV